MHHVAIMKKSWGLLPKILDGTKTIESRWYKNKSSPWGKIKKGDFVYFKNSGEKITVSAKVKDTLSFENLTPSRVLSVLKKYGQADGICLNDLNHFSRLFKDRKYCLLVFLENIKREKPFSISKSGFGAMAAWICVENIETLKVS